MSAVGALVVLFSSAFAVYLASNIEDIKTTVAVMSRDSQRTQADLTKLELKIDQADDRITKLELRRPMIGGSMHEQ